MDICQKVKHQLHKTKPNCRGDNTWNYHSQLSQVLHIFKTSKSRLRGVTLPMGPTGVIGVDIVPRILYVIQDVQEGDMLCVRYWPHMPQIQCQLRLCNVDYKGLACHNRKCKYLYADPMILLHNLIILQFDNVCHSLDWTMHFSTRKWLILTVAYLVLHQWRHFTHSARVWLKLSLMLWLTMYPQAKRQHWTAMCCIFTKRTGKAFAVHPHPQPFAMG